MREKRDHERGGGERETCGEERERREAATRRERREEARIYGIREISIELRFSL